MGGRTRAISIDPTNPAEMLAAGVAGGVFKSTDAGASWAPTDDHLLNLAVCTMVRAPGNPDVVYAGTGEGYGASIFVRGLGIFKSTDGGDTWTQLPSTSTAQAGSAFYYVNKLAVSGNDPDVIWAGTRHGVFRSTDAGASWEIRLSNPWASGTPPFTNGCQLGCLDLAVRTDRNPDVVYAAFGSFGADGLYRSDDGGQTWTEYATPSWQGRMTIAIAPTNQDRVYVAMADNGGLTQLGRIADLWRADDGVTFQSVLDFDSHLSPWLFSYASIATGCLTGYPIYSQGWYDQTIAVSPTDPDVLFLGGINLYRSDDAGQTFGLMGYWMTYDPPTPQLVHVDQHTIVPHPDWNGTTNQTLIVGNDGGIWRTFNALAATSQEECPLGDNPGPPPAVEWEHFDDGYAVTQFYHGAVARTADVFIAGAQDNSVQRVTSVATPNAWEELMRGDGGYCAIDPTNELVMYSEIQGFPTIRKSTDGGDTFFSATNGITDTNGLFITPFAMAPSDPNVLWTGGTRPWRTKDAAALWKPKGPDFAGAAQISAIGISPVDRRYVYLGFTNGYVAYTTNGYAGTPVWTVTVADLPVGAWISDVAVDGLDPAVAYVTFSTFGVDHVWRTTDGGASWTAIDGIAAAGVPDIPVHSIAIRPGASHQLYAGTELGVFASDDAGATWHPANAGLAHTVVEELAFRDDDTLVAFTFGRGVFVASLDPEPTAAPPPAPAGGLALTATPNPFRRSVEIVATSAAPGPVRITVHDVAGRLVRTLAEGHATDARLVRRWDGRDADGAPVSPGAYFVRAATAERTSTAKIVRVR